MEHKSIMYRYILNIQQQSMYKCSSRDIYSFLSYSISHNIVMHAFLKYCILYTDRRGFAVLPRGSASYWGGGGCTKFKKDQSLKETPKFEVKSLWKMNRPTGLFSHVWYAYFFIKNDFIWHSEKFETVLQKIKL
jgi:hypothetical protein